MSTIDELKRCLQALAQPADVQVSLFPDFVVVGDELALSFDEALTRHRAANGSFSSGQASSLEALDAYLEELSGPHNETFWCDPASLESDPRWQRIRDFARTALDAFAWAAVVPPPDGAIYVVEDKTVRNEE